MERVLVCDDDVIISEVVAIILFDSELAEVFTLPDCIDIIKKIDEIKPSVILMDHNIPGDGGIVATRAIKNHPIHKHIPVIYFTGSEDIDALAKAAGADYTLAKPFNISHLEQVVNKSIKLRKAS